MLCGAKATESIRHINMRKFFERGGRYYGDNNQTFLR